MLAITTISWLVPLLWLYSQRRRDKLQDLFLLAGNILGVSMGIGLRADVHMITFALLPWTVLIALVASAAAHSVFGWELLEESEDGECLDKKTAGLAGYPERGGKGGSCA